MKRKNDLLGIIFFQVCLIPLVLFSVLQSSAQAPIGKPTTTLSIERLQAEIPKDIYLEKEGIVSGPPAPKIKEEDYFTPKFLNKLGGSRVVIWVLAQQHFFFGGLLVGVLFLVTFFELTGSISKKKESIQRYDGYAYEMLRVLILTVSLTSILGGIFLFGLVAFYSDLIKYLAGVFRPFSLIFGLLILAFNIILYFYYQTWKGMYEGWSKWFHVGLGLLSNLIGTFIFLLANSWSSFMVSPSGVDRLGRFLGNNWDVLNNPLWISTSVHRFFSNIVFGGTVMAAYAAYHALIAETSEERARYDRMGFTAFLATVVAIFSLPYGGYWLLRKVYAYSQGMGITLLGGLLAGLGVMLVILVGAIFSN